MKEAYDIETISQDSRSSIVHRNAPQVLDNRVEHSASIDIRLSNSSSKPAIREEGSSELKEGIIPTQHILQTRCDSNDVMKSSDSWFGAQSLASDQSNNSSSKAKIGVNDISEIDRRIQALQAYLDNAR
jgi:hypothetical protein